MKLNIKSVGVFIQKMLQKIKTLLRKKAEVKTNPCQINLLLIRDTFNEVCTLGKLFLNGEWVGDTLENPWKNNQRNISSIPANIYPVRLRYPVESVKFKYTHLLIQDVKDRGLILFHRGNTAKDTSGCILLGVSREHNRVNKSKYALDLLIKEILLLGNENITLTIKNR